MIRVNIRLFVNDAKLHRGSVMQWTVMGRRKRHSSAADCRERGGASPEDTGLKGGNYRLNKRRELSNGYDYCHHHFLFRAMQQ